MMLVRGEFCAAYSRCCCRGDLQRRRRCGRRGFDAWLQSLWPQAQALGVSRATFDTATRGLEPDLSLPGTSHSRTTGTRRGGQPEFVQTPADYLKESTIDRWPGKAQSA